jgi:hypothetical protein
MLIPKRRFISGSRQWGIWDTEISDYVEIERRTPEGRFAGYVANFNTKRECQETINQVVNL